MKNKIESKKVIISSIVPIGDQFQKKANEVIKAIKQLYLNRNLSCIDHSKIQPTKHLNRPKFRRKFRGNNPGWSVKDINYPGKVCYVHLWDLRGAANPNGAKNMDLLGKTYKLLIYLKKEKSGNDIDLYKIIRNLSFLGNFLTIFR